MKRNILLLFALCFGFAVQAQDLTLAPDNLELTANLDDPTTNPGDVVGHSFVTNNTNATKTYVWERVLNDLPAGTVWASAICDVNNCYLPSVSTKEFILEPGQMGTLDVHMYPGGTPGALSGALPGEGQVQVRIWEKDNESVEVLGTFDFAITSNSTSTTELEEIKQLKVFPNPVNDFVQISENSIVEEVEVFNLIGERVLRFPATNGQRYNVSALKKGIYLFQMVGEDGLILKTIKLIKA